MSYNSKYSGQQVENLLDQVANGNLFVYDLDWIPDDSTEYPVDLDFTQEQFDIVKNANVVRVMGAPCLLINKSDFECTFQAEIIFGTTDREVMTLVFTSDYVHIESEAVELATKLELDDKVDKTEIPTKVSQLENDAEYAVPIHAESQSLSFGVSHRFPFAGSDLELNTTQQQRYEDTELELSYNKYGGITENTVVGAYVTYYKIGGATSEKAGFMTKEDKIKLDGIDMASKQDTLVSGTSIKTVNGTSILGSGNITISGGITTPLYPLRVHSMDDDNVSINPGEYHMWPMPMTALTITLAGSSGLYCAHWIFRFSSESTPTTLSLPNLQWANGNEISISPNKTYEVSIIDGLAVWAEF